MKRSLIVFLLPVLAVDEVFAQKRTTHIQQFWAAYFNQTRISERVGTWTDLQLRTREDFFTNMSTSIARVGATYYANNDLKFTLGYGYVTHYFPGDEGLIGQPEHRPWQQVQWHVNKKKSRVMQYLRLEERYRRKIEENELGDGYDFNWKLRHNFLLLLPLHANTFAKGTFSVALNNEVHVNFGKEIVNNYFDQNRFFVALTYHVNHKDNIQAGYMNLFQQLPQGNEYRSLHVPRIVYNHNLDLRKK